MVRALSPTGIAIVTLEGRRAENIQDHHRKLIEDKHSRLSVAATGRRGFGFAIMSVHSACFLLRTAMHRIGEAELGHVRFGADAGHSNPRVRSASVGDNQDLVVFCRPAATG